MFYCYCCCSFWFHWTSWHKLSHNLFWTVWIEEDAHSPLGAHENSVFAYSLYLITKINAWNTKAALGWSVMVLPSHSWELLLKRQSFFLSSENLRFTHLLPSWPWLSIFEPGKNVFYFLLWKVLTLLRSKTQRVAAYCTPVARFDISTVSCNGEV